jgi:hypothetical protein
MLNPITDVLLVACVILPILSAVVHLYFEWRWNTRPPTSITLGPHPAIPKDTRLIINGQSFRVLEDTPANAGTVTVRGRRGGLVWHA